MNERKNKRLIRVNVPAYIVERIYPLPYYILHGLCLSPKEPSLSVDTSNTIHIQSHQLMLRVEHTSDHVVTSVPPQYIHTPVRYSAVPGAARL